MSHTERNANQKTLHGTAEDPYAEVALNISDILTLSPTSLAKQSSQNVVGGTQPIALAL